MSLYEYLMASSIDPDNAHDYLRMHMTDMLDEDDMHEQAEEHTYTIRRYYMDYRNPDHGMVIAEGVTLEEARAHCNDDATSGPDWFDAYDRD